MDVVVALAAPYSQLDDEAHSWALPDHLIPRLLDGDPFWYAQL